MLHRKIRLKFISNRDKILFREFDLSDFYKNFYHYILTRKESIKMKSKGISIREIIIITFGMLLVASGVYFFMIPGNIVAGSVSGLALVLSKLSGIQVSVLTFILNAFLLIIGFILSLIHI